jgi:hypothetical protein
VANSSLASGETASRQLGVNLAAWLALIRQRWILLVSIQTMFLIIAVGDSQIFPTYESTVLVLIPAKDDSAALESHSVDIRTSERFLVTQMSVITSDIILEAVLAKAPGIGHKRVEDLRVALDIQRAPFDNAVTIRLSQADPSALIPTLTSIVETYSTWFRTERTAGAMDFARLLEAQISHQLTRVAQAESAIQNTTAGPSTGVSQSDDWPDTGSAPNPEAKAVLDLETQRLQLLVEKKQEVGWFLDRNASVSIPILSGPSKPAKANALPRAAILGLGTGLLSNLLLVYFLSACRFHHRRLDP